MDMIVFLWRLRCWHTVQYPAHVSAYSHGTIDKIIQYPPSVERG